MTLCAVVVGHDSQTDRIAEVLREHLEPELRVAHVAALDDVDSLADTGRSTSANGVQENDADATTIALIALFVDSHLDHVNTLAKFCAKAGNRNVRILGVTNERVLSHLGLLANYGKPDYLAYFPDLTREQFTTNVDTQLRRFQVLNDMPVTRKPQYTGALVGEERTETEMVEEIVRRVDETLGFQPRIHIPEGVTLTREGEPVEEIYLALSGRVSLSRRTNSGDIVMHHASTGRIIGLLALMRGSEGFLTARTTTEVTGIQLSFEQLNELIDADPSVMPLLGALTMRSFERRLRRSENIQIEKVELASELEIERTNLASALRNLEGARTELTAQARFASLGELAAGVAHELNNPMAAIARTADHLDDDLHKLIESSGEKKWIRQTIEAMNAAETSPSLTTKEARALRAEFTKFTKDPELSQRLVLAGIHDPQLAKDVSRTRKVSFEAVETAAAIGSAIRNLRTASTRITQLVASLRAYARPDGDPVTDININDTIDDTLRLINHRLHRIELERKFRDVPTVTGHPGELGQVWTNLLTNAAEALQEARPDDESYGTIRIETSAKEAGWVEIRVIDNGPGIPVELQERLFEPRFTTKNGQVRFGMGIGLGVCRSIVQKHNGTMELVSNDAGTTAVVRLPLNGPLTHKEDA